MNSMLSSETWTSLLKGDSLPWLLEEENAEVRSLTLRDLLDRPAGDAELLCARQACCEHGAIAKVLGRMEPEGYWVKPGAGYGPKYRSTVWAIILLAQLGADCSLDPRVKTACDYLVENSLSPTGGFSHNGAPGGTFDCLQGNLCTSLLDLGWSDSRLDGAFEWMARTVTGEGVASQKDKTGQRRYYAYKCGPNFACGANASLPCAWGAAKVMMALAKLPKARHTPLIERAIEQGVDFLFSVDPAGAGYPATQANPNRSWWKFGFPVFYITDILQIAEALALLGYGKDSRLKNALDLILSKQDDAGRWPLEYSYESKTWINPGKIGKPSKWVTLRAMRMLKTTGEANP